MQKIQLLDLKKQYERIREEVKQAIDEVLEEQRFILGERVKKLEKIVSEKSNAGYGIGVASGSDALLLSLMALGVGKGDEVITTPFTFFATAGSIARLGARPVFVDISPDDFNIDVNQIEDAITGRTKVILPVHLYGQMVDIQKVMEIAKKHHLYVVEDVAQAIFAYQTAEDRIRVIAGSKGDTGCISFFPSKNLGAYGDGGMVITSDEKLAEKLKQLRVHGSVKQYHHKYVGLNSRLDEIQAAILNVKIKYIDGWISDRRKNADNYRKLFKEYKLDDFIGYPVEKAGFYHTYHQFVIRVRSHRDRLMKYLNENGVACRVYYPVPLHLQESFFYLGYKEGDFPNSERACKEVLALPIYPELKEEEQEYIVKKIGEFYGV